MNGVRVIAGTATMPAFRRRGVQHALVAHALNAGAGRASIATATTEPGSISQRTFERLGFQVMYTRAIFVLS
jgi:ribosomal protein S18 acetylase RimI-like enzyme